MKDNKFISKKMKTEKIDTMCECKDKEKISPRNGRWKGWRINR